VCARSLLSLSSLSPLSLSSLSLRSNRISLSFCPSPSLAPIIIIIIIISLSPSLSLQLVKDQYPPDTPDFAKNFCNEALDVPYVAGQQEGIDVSVGDTDCFNAAGVISPAVGLLAALILSVVVILA
jgi:hypothetical protein